MVNARDLLQRKTPTRFVAVKASVPKEHYDEVAAFDINVNDLVCDAFKEVYMQLKKDQTLRSLGPVVRENIVHEKRGDLDLTVNTMRTRILRTLEQENQPLTSNELAERHGDNPGSLAAMVSVMLRDGQIDKTLDRPARYFIPDATNKATVGSVVSRMG